MSGRGGLFALALPVLGFFVPAALWIAKSAFDGDAAGSAPAAPQSFLPGDWGRVAWTTAYIAGGGALGATILGGAAALIFEAFPIRARALLMPLLLLPFLMPAAALATALHAALGGGSLRFLAAGATGALVLSALQMAPVVFWGAARHLAALPAAERDSLRAALAPARAAVRVLAPRVVPAASRLGALAFLLLVPRMEYADYAGVETIGTRVLASFTVRESDWEGWVLVAAIICIVLPLVAVAARGAAGIAPAALGEARAGDRDARAPAAEFVLWAAAALALVPLLLLASRAWPFDGFAVRAWSIDLARECARAFAVAAAIGVLGFLVACARTRAASLLFALPLFLPGTLPALAIAGGVQEWIPQALYDTPLALSVAQAVRFGGVALLFGFIAHGALPAAERQAAAASLPPGRALWRVEFPRALPILASGVLVSALLILGDVESALLLAPPGYGVPALELNQFLHFRYDANAAQLALLLTGAAALAAVALWRFGRGLR
ncbi:MAG: hypothetical protein L0Z55_06600 [Planctomycetes bacterium]|nr:hypothetical protein [Planctomycetota bacterium]